MKPLTAVKSHLEIFEVKVLAGVNNPNTTFSVREFFESVSPYGREFLTLLFVVPFLQPIPIWGLSSLLGLFLAFLHGRYFIFGSHSLLPARVASYQISSKNLLLLLRGAQKLLAWLNRMPNWLGEFSSVAFLLRTNAAAMALLGLFLSLPLPIPGSNAAPAYAILFFVVSELTENVLLLLLAWLSFLGNLAFFVMLGLLPWLGIQWI